MAPSSDIRKLIAQLPKAELHVHLRGAIPIRVLAEMMDRHDAQRALESAPDRVKAMWRDCTNLRPFLAGERWSTDDIRGLFRYESFRNFLLTYYFTGFFVRDCRDLRALVSGVLADMESQGIVYAEITVSAAEYVDKGIPLQEVFACLEEGGESAGMWVQWIIDLIRDLGPDSARDQLTEIIALRPRSVVGITLGGTEDAFPTRAFADVYAMARDHGLRCTVHAGEAAGAESVREAVEALEVERIGHGVRAVEDPSLVQRLAERGIALEVCPTSNLCTGVYSSYEEHPARELDAADVPITINSDDPTFFETSLADEYVRAYEMGFAPTDLLRLLRNGFRYSFLPSDDAGRCISQLDEAWSRAAPDGSPAGQ
jgi:adenosine deaminase